MRSSALGRGAGHARFVYYTKCDACPVTRKRVSHVGSAARRMLLDDASSSLHDVTRNREFRKSGRRVGHRLERPIGGAAANAKLSTWPTRRQWAA